jgi:hypothetical protein
MFGLIAAALTGIVAAQNGPSALYTLLNGQTFNPPGYTIVMYQSCVQNQNAGNPCGSFSGYQSSGGQYTYQLYGPEAAVSPTCSRTFHLTLACGPTLLMSGVNENPTCVYSATLSLPQVCGVDLTVGNEAASVSPSALPPTPSTSITASPSYSSTNTMTSTPLYMITAFPSTTSTTTLTATGTPLFMITAWPSSSPVNVSATSTPLYYYTAYPSVGSNSSNGLLGFASSMMSSGSTTSMIIGGVALSVVGVGAIAWVVHYFRNGGTIGGLISKVRSEQGNIAKFAGALPISAEAKARLTGAIADPSSVIPPQAQAALEQMNEKKQALLESLPPQLSAMVEAKEAQVRQKGAEMLSFAPVSLNSLAPLTSLAPSSVSSSEVIEVAAEVATTVTPADVEAFQAFLAFKAATNAKSE